MTYINFVKEGFCPILEAINLKKPGLSCFTKRSVAWIIRKNTLLRRNVKNRSIQLEDAQSFHHYRVVLRSCKHNNYFLAMHHYPMDYIVPGKRFIINSHEIRRYHIVKHVYYTEIDQAHGIVIPKH